MRIERLGRTEVFANGASVAARRFVLRAPVPPHVHDFVELAVVTGGSAQHTTAEGGARLGPGEVVVVRPGAWHAYDPEPGPEPFAVTNAYVGPETLHGELAWVLGQPPLARLLLVGGRLPEPLPPAALARVAGWLAQLEEEGDRPLPALATALLQCVLLEVARASAPPDPTAPAPLSTAVRTALAAMNDDVAHPWTVRGLAGRAGLSPSSLHRQFRDQLGHGPIEWLTLARAEAAASLLVRTDLPVAAVGRMVGWPDPSYATRRFSRIYSLSPTAYRREHAAAGTELA